jgi:hypothetical protein
VSETSGLCWLGLEAIYCSAVLSGIKGNTRTHRQQGDLINILNLARLFFQNKESALEELITKAKI